MSMDNFDSPFLYNRPKIDTESLKKAIVSKLIFSGIRILWWKRAYKSPFSKFLISVEKSTPKLSVMS